MLCKPSLGVLFWFLFWFTIQCIVGIQKTQEPAVGKHTEASLLSPLYLLLSLLFPFQQNVGKKWCRGAWDPVYLPIPQQDNGLKARKEERNCHHVWWGGRNQGLKIRLENCQEKFIEKHLKKFSWVSLTWAATAHKAPPTAPCFFLVTWPRGKLLLKSEKESPKLPLPA